MRSILTVLILAAASIAAADDQKAVARITDQFGNPPPEQMPLGELLVFSARTSVKGESPSAVKWTVLPAERDVRKWSPPDNGLEVAVPTGQKPVTITVILSVARGDSVDHTMLTVKCGEGDIPPPVPPGPEPKPPTPSDQKLFVAVVHNTAAITPDQAIVLGDARFWDGLKARGHAFRRFDVASTEATAAKIRTGVDVNAGPVVVLMDETQTNILQHFALPRTTAEIDSQLKRLSTR